MRTALESTLTEQKIYGAGGRSVLNEAWRQEVFPPWELDLNVWQNMLWSMHILQHTAPVSG